ncbi:hypothetical protein DCC81_17020 [Chitinophaga parva]|uniref:Sphingomyelin synthase-like domain-containing protein n=1 Tax=Chitinophaga parva TaxID=2169414 RepID=A0A2T7BI33_9BACT|nr:phosphatase PAP2-related protein [Chitinophaga parva]PUZ25946.1 hypothetical protein DCC81_17020 [Chitinophaga parva]
MEVKWKNDPAQSLTYAMQHPWKANWQIPAFKRRVIGGVVALIGVLSYLPAFFQRIEMRNGYVLHDFVLQVVPASDVSVPIFLLIWLSAGYTLYQASRQPEVFVRLLYGFLFVCLSRIITIYLVALNPPLDLIQLKDPLSNQFYGKAGFITKDLFYSGHTATVCLLAYCLPGRWEKWVVGGIAAVVAALLLVQHVHYTMDVLTAPLLTYACYRLAASINWDRPLLRRVA